MNLLVHYQLNVMMMLGGICGFIFLFLLSMKISNKAKKHAFLQIAFWTMILLFSDRFCYMFRGDVSELGYWMVRICNFLVFAATLLAENGFNEYLISLEKDWMLEERETRILKISRLLAIIGLSLLIISQFTGMYYTFDESNRYQRSGGFLICYAMPLIITIIQFAFILKHRKKYSSTILISLMIFLGAPFLASIVQIFFYGLSLLNIATGVSTIFLYFFALFDQNNVLVRAAVQELKQAKEMREKTGEMLQQTIEALATAIDANDPYTHGHSTRVAKYSKKIAEMSGMSVEECEKVYLAALLHDVGKIGISDSILNKPGRLTDEEFAVIKQHPALGEQILAHITTSPYLRIGAHYHHERYDGTGYPKGLKGEDIPRVARIIAVADAYDAMTSKRSYRDQIAQQKVREEIVKGLGTQFDPKYGKQMLQLVDLDEEFRMREHHDVAIFGDEKTMEFEELKQKYTAGLRITDLPITVRLRYASAKADIKCVPTILLYDALDERYVEDDYIKTEMDFVEYGSICFDGTVTQCDHVRNIKQTTTIKEEKDIAVGIYKEATIRLVKKSDHLMVTIISAEKVEEVIFALNDKSRYVFMALTGEYCSAEVMEVTIDANPVDDSYIPRIAEEISFINCPAGDIPNVEVDGWRTDSSETIKVEDNMEISFHTLSLPSAKRIWHCPILCVYISDDGKINGPNYKELSLIRFDGESWSECEDVVNSAVVSKDESFSDWNDWKKKNKEGTDCKLKIYREDDKIIVRAENSGVTIINQTKTADNIDELYVFLTGDQCAITNIQIHR